MATRVTRESLPSSSDEAEDTVEEIDDPETLSKIKAIKQTADLLYNDCPLTRVELKREASSPMYKGKGDLTSSQGKVLNDANKSKEILQMLGEPKFITDFRAE